MGNINDLVIKNKKLQKYTGEGGDVVIPDGVTSIGKEAFDCCKALTGITIPGSVTSIGDAAFYGCKSLTSITIPNSVTSIGDSAFCGCEALTSITIPDSVKSIGDSAFTRCFGLADEHGLVIVADILFDYRGNESHITIPDGVKSISGPVFFEDAQLTSITIPEGVGIPNLHPLKNNGVF